jgi:hypothetical protein
MAPARWAVGVDLATCWRRAGHKPIRRRLSFSTINPPLEVTSVVIAVMIVITRIFCMIEIEHVKEIANRRHVHRNPRILGIHDRIRQVVTAAIRYFSETPVPLNEF